MVNATINFVSVRGTFQRAAAPGIDMVRRTARFSQEKYGTTSTRNCQDRDLVSILFYCLHNRSAFRYRTNNEKTVYQVYLPFCFVLYISL